MPEGLSETDQLRWSREVQDGKVLHDTDKDQSGWTAFCKSLSSTNIEKLILVDVGMGPVGLTTLAKLTLDSAALSEVNLSMNRCFGDREGYDEDGDEIRVHDIDKDQTGWTAFCEAIKDSKSIQTLVLSDIGIGPVGLTTLAKFIPGSTAMTAVNVMKNPISDDGLGKLMSAIDGTSVKTISGMTF